MCITRAKTRRGNAQACLHECLEFEVDCWSTFALQRDGVARLASAPHFMRQIALLLVVLYVLSFEQEARK
jgi:hypothetical protein